MNYPTEWRSGLPETPCGKGSKLSETGPLRAWLPKIVERYQIRTVADVGAGDMNWIRHVEWDVEYQAYDVRPRDRSVKKFDVCRDVLPKTDLILLIAVLQHLRIDEANAALDRIKESGSRYLLMTYSSRDGFRILGRPLESIFKTEKRGLESRYGIWEINCGN